MGKPRVHTPADKLAELREREAWLAEHWGDSGHRDEMRKARSELREVKAQIAMLESPPAIDPQPAPKASSRKPIAPAQRLLPLTRSEALVAYKRGALTLDELAQVSRKELEASRASRELFMENDMEFLERFAANPSSSPGDHLRYLGIKAREIERQRIQAENSRAENDLARYGMNEKARQIETEEALRKVIEREKSIGGSSV